MKTHFTYYTDADLYACRSLSAGNTSEYGQCGPIVRRHAGFAASHRAFGLDAYLRNAGAGRRLVLTSARRGVALHRFAFTENDSLVFGRETSGLPPEVIALSPHHVRIPIKGEVRSINLSTAAGIVLFQALASAGMVGE